MISKCRVWTARARTRTNRQCQLYPPAQGFLAVLGGLLLLGFGYLFQFNWVRREGVESNVSTRAKCPVLARDAPLLAAPVPDALLSFV